MAGLFALLYGFFSIGSTVISETKFEIDKKAFKDIALKNKNLTYWVNGQEYFCANDLPCITTTNYKNKHKIIICSKGKYQGKILYDYDKEEEKRENEQLKKDIEEAKINNKKYINTKYNNKLIKCWNYTGYEIKTKRKYCVYKLDEQTYILTYLKDKPRKEYTDYGYKDFYDSEEKFQFISEEEFYERAGINKRS